MISANIRTFNILKFILSLNINPPYFSNNIVTGPSFIKLTFISDANLPYLASIFLDNSSLKTSNKWFASLGSNAFSKDGLLPFLQFVYKENWGTERISPLISIIDKLIFPSLSSNILSFNNYLSFYLLFH